MDKSDLFEMLDKAGDFVEALAPIAGAIGGPVVGSILGVIGSIDEVVENIATVAKEGKAVLSTDDVQVVDAALNRVRRANDALNELIKAS